MLFYSFFKSLVGKDVVVELKNDLSICGTLHSVDQYLNIKLTDISVTDPEKYPHMVTLQRLQVTEASPTDLTGIRFLPRVNQHVGAKMSNLNKRQTKSAISDSALPNKGCVELQTKSSVNFISIHLGDV
uniref:Smx5 n=1 Tax=Amphiprion ocellaris TaxID=80972 RepID=A0AAQ5WYY5_AMPOC